MIKSVLAAIFIALAVAGAAQAQEQIVLPCYQNPSAGGQGCIPVSAANPLPVTGGGGGGGAVTLPTTPSIANGSGVVPTQGGSALSTTNGAYTNVLQGNAVLSPTNPLPVSRPAPAAPTVSASGSVTSLILKGSATIATGGVEYFHAENATATAGYCILYNGTTAPSTGALTAANVLAFQNLPASGYCDWTASNNPLAASTGAVILVSSGATPFTYTTGTVTASIYGLAQ